MSNKTLQQFNNNSKTAFIFRFLITFGTMAGIIYGALYYFDFLNSNKPAVARKPATEQAATVDTMVIDIVDVQPIISNFGQIIAGKQLPLSTSVSGRVKYISEHFKVGAVVKAGELLLEIDDFEYRGNLLNANANLQDITFKATDIDNQVSSTEINYKSTLSLYENAQKDYAGSEKLQKTGIISSQALDDKNMALIQQKQSLDSMLASFNNLKNQKNQLLATTEIQQWAVDKAKKDLGNTKIYAPFDAYIHNATLEVGQYIGVNSTIATLLDQQKIDVKFTLSDGQYGRIIAQDGTIIGREIKVIWQIGQIEKTFDAVINRVNSEIVAASGGIDLYATIINVETVEALRIGAFVKILIPDQTYSQVISIPDYMVYDNDVVYVVARLAEDEPEQAVQTEGDANTDAEKPTQKRARSGDQTQTGARQSGQRQGTQGEGAQGQGTQRQGKRANAQQGQQGSNNAKTDDVKPVDKKTEDAKSENAESDDSAQGKGQFAGRQGQNGGKKSEPELKENEKRLEPVNIKIVGYNGDQVLIANLDDVENPLQIGDALLQTRLTLAGNGVLIITSEESARKQAEALAKLKERDANGEGNSNRRFGGRGGNLFGGSGGRGR